jgi:hypothetical protein
MNRTGPLALASIPSADNQVIVSIALGSAVEVAAIDLYGASVSGEVAGLFRLETSINGSSWDKAGPEVEIWDEGRHVRLALNPADQRSVGHVRVVLANGAAVAGADFSATGLSVLADQGCDENVRFWPFSAPEGVAYMLAVTCGNADVYRLGKYECSIPLPYTATQIMRVQTDKRLDTMIAAHQNVPEHLIRNEKSDTAWSSLPAEFVNVPLEQFDGETYTNGKNEKQILFFRGFSAGDTFNILLDGERTGNIAIAASFAGIETSIKSALEALDILGPGQTICTKTGNKEVTVEFTGEAGQKDWPQMFISVVESTEGVGIVSTVQEGEEGGEPMISATRGYSRCVAFWSGRTNLLGLRSLPLTGIATLYGDYFDFNQGAARATDGVEYLIDSDDDDGVRSVQKRARHPLLFTTSGVWYLPVDALSGETPPGALSANVPGFEEAVTPLPFDGGTAYVEYGGTKINLLEWTGPQTEWVNTDISVRASHLIAEPIDFCTREAARGFKSALLHVVRRDGEVATFVSKRGEFVSAWTRMATPAGKILAMGTDKLGRTYAAVRRQIGETVHWTIECELAGRTLDGGGVITLEDEDTIAAPQLEGLDVWVTDGNDAYGPYTVENGVITLEAPLTATVEYGLLYPAWIIPQDVRGDQGESLAGLTKQIRKVRVKLLDSTAPQLVIYGDTWTMRPSANQIQEGLDTALGPVAERRTGWVGMDDFNGEDEVATCRLQRWVPGPFRIQAIKITAEIAEGE